MARKNIDPSLRPEPTASENWITDLFVRIESRLISVVALFLIAFVAIALAAVIKEVKDPLLDLDFGTAAIKGTDATFLAIILLELLHTTLSRGPISEQVREFLAIGITATVRHGLDIAASRGNGQRDVVINLAINMGAALVLVVALWLTQHQTRADQQVVQDTASGVGAE